MKQALYELTDFLEDPDFIRWVKHPDTTQDAYWQQFLDAHPEKKLVVEMARQYVLIFAEQTGQHQPTAAQSELMRQYIQKHVQAEKGEVIATPFTRTVGTNWNWLRMAASIALVISIGLGAYWYSQTQGVPPESYQQFKKANSVGTTLKETRNDTDKPLTVLLSDGSSVVLQPDSRLSYPDKFQQREVYLTGKAFFEIVKDPTHPFLVYTRGIATKVLGTSFMVDAPATGQPIKVAVKTGRVAVYALEESASVRQKASNPELEGLVLTPNQGAEYSVESKRLVRMPGSVFTQPETQVVAKQSFDFDETPVSEVFSMLEKAYGVHIVYDETMLGKCSLSASLVGQPFHDKLAIVCKALEAQYAIQGNQVTITGGQRCQ
ncbi:FecR family protein [Spirosoma foliorum]|uniref:FecR family protein n=1 Tax=Spirosoma foliorum TaxID=2710596 RepID=A0A7G5GZT5_9BACT|nr:FecR family protein [Spirosoma foliorum]QMW04377.1 FecR family protein [Spirosoma foliorum]